MWPVIMAMALPLLAIATPLLVGLMALKTKDAHPDSDDTPPFIGL